MSGKPNKRAKKTSRVAKPKAKDEKPTTALVKSSGPNPLATSLDLYLADINRFPLLTRDEEYALAVKYFKTGDMQAAHKLVTSNLRFVVKIAMQYNKYGIKLTDLIQEGNVGLMLAVKKFNPHRGYRLISYAVWWIKAYIQKYLLDSWSVVRLGTTQAQRKLFNSMKKIQRQLRAMEGEEPSDEVLAEALDVRVKDVVEMRNRLEGKDLSLNTPIDDERGTSRLDLMQSNAESAEDHVIRKSEQQLVHKAVRQLKPKLNNKEVAVLEERLLAEEPVTLQELGDKFSISRERVRQIEEALKKKLRQTVEGMQVGTEENKQ